MPRKSKINRYIFFTTAFLILSLEISVRVIFEDGLGKQNTFRLPVPYRMHAGLPHAVYEFETLDAVDRVNAIDTLNVLGFRGRLPPHLKGGEYRIIMLGGSTVLNKLSTVDSSLPGQLEKHFRDDGFERVRVYNWGGIAYVSGQELSLLLNEVTNYDPDLVLVYDGANDICHRWWYDPRPGYPYNFLVYEEGMSRMGRMSAGDIALAVLQKSRLLGILFPQSMIRQILGYEGLREKAGYGTAEWERAIVASYIGNIEKMCSLAHGFEFKLMVFLQPVIHLKRSLTEAERRMTKGEPFTNYTRRMYASVSEEFLRLNGRHEADALCRYVDFHLIFSDRPERTYDDYVHITDSSRAYIAEHMYSEVIEFLGDDLPERGTSARIR